MNRRAVLLLLTLSACGQSSAPCTKCPTSTAQGITSCPSTSATTTDGAGEGDCGGPSDMQQATYSAKGLFTYPNPLAEVPDGAFSRADDVVIRRGGIAETRRGFSTASGTFGSSGDRLASLTDFAGTLVGRSTTGTLYRYDGSSTWTAYSGTYTPPASQRMRYLQMAKDLFFTTTAGVYRLDSATGTPTPAGVPQATGGTAATTGLGAHATGTVTLGGSAGNPTITVGGTAVGPVTYAGSDTATAAACVTALNANGTVAALVTASSSGAVITLTAVNGGTGGNSITLTASRSAGTATASGANLTGGTAGTGVFLPSNAQTAYRFVWGTRDANNRLILGAPSGRLPLTNPSTETTASVALTVSIPTWVTASHFLQVYRADTSADATIPASDDMQLVYETYPSTSALAARSLTFTDITPDAIKGAALYSSPNQGVPGSEKFQPPVCTDLAEFKGRMWCSTTVQRQRLLLTLLSVDGTSGGLNTGDAISFTDGASTETYQASASESALSSPALFKLYSNGSVSQNIANTAQSLVRVINAQSNGMAQAFYVSGDYDSPGQLLIERRTLGGSALSVTALRHGRMWAPAMPTPVDGFPVSRTSNVVTVTVGYGVGELQVGQQIVLTGYSNGADATAFPSGTKTITAVNTGSNTFTYAETGANGSASGTITYTVQTPAVVTDPTAAPNSLAYSEYGEPDAVPLGNYLSAGSANYKVLRVVPLGDTLFIFKEDGTWILTGDAPETFSIRQFPTPAKLLAPDSVVVLGNSIYALTDQGAMSFTENGAQVISRPIEGDLLPLYSGNATMKATLSSVAFGVAYETEREYHLWLPSTSSDTYATQSYVYNYATQAWTRWTKPATCGYVLPGADVEYLGKATANAALVERKTRTAADCQDDTGNAISSAVTWQVRTGGDPSAYKQWQKATVMLDAASPSSVLLSMATELTATAATGTMTTDGLPYVSSFVPVEQSRSQTLSVGVSGGEANTCLTVRGLSVDYLPSSTSLR